MSAPMAPRPDGSPDLLHDDRPVVVKTAAGATARPDGPDRGTAGAVYVEFLIAFIPVFFFFLSLVQLAFVQAANIINQHAATRAVRAAVVILHDDPKFYGGVPMGSASGKRKTEIERAAKLSLIPLGFGANDVNVVLDGSYGRDAMVKVRLELNYKCKVPWGRFSVCGSNNKKKLTAEASMPNQGADYQF